LLTKEQLKDCLHKRGLSRLRQILLILAVDVEKPKMVQEIKGIGREAGLTKIQRWNVSDILTRNRHYAARLLDGWSLTSDGRSYIKSLNVIPTKTTITAVKTAADLRKIMALITDEDIKLFLNESITCFEGDLYRAAVVLSWEGAISLLYNKIIASHLSDFNSEALKRDRKWKKAKTKDDLTRMKETEFLEIIAAPPISIIGRDVKEELKNSCLRLRNSCGHPNSLKISGRRVATHLEILILNIFQKFC